MKHNVTTGPTVVIIFVPRQVRRIRNDEKKNLHLSTPSSPPAGVRCERTQLPAVSPMLHQRLLSTALTRAKRNDRKSREIITQILSHKNTFSSPPSDGAKFAGVSTRF